MSHFRVKLWRKGKLIATRAGKNTATLEGLEHVMDKIMKRPGSPGGAAWRFAPYTAGSIVVGSTAASPGVTEFTDYTFDFFGTNTTDRSPNTRVDGVTTGDGTAFFTEFTSENGGSAVGPLAITGSGSIKGAFWATGVAKGSTSGFLWGGADFNSPVDVESGDDMTIEYTLTAEASDSLGSP